MRNRVTKKRRFRVRDLKCVLLRERRCFIKNTHSTSFQYNRCIVLCDMVTCQCGHTRKESHKTLELRLTSTHKHMNTGNIRSNDEEATGVRDYGKG